MAGVTVEVDYSKTNDSKKALERAITKFKKKLDKEGIMDEIKKRQYYVKPSARKHLKKVHDEHIRKLIKKDAEHARPVEDVR